MSRRSKLDIIYSMLTVIRDQGGSSKPTHVMYKANLSYKQFKGYQQELEESEVIVEKEIDKGKHMLDLTDRGYEMIAKIEELKAFDDIFGI